MYRHFGIKWGRETGRIVKKILYRQWAWVNICFVEKNQNKKTTKVAERAAVEKYQKNAK